MLTWTCEQKGPQGALLCIKADLRGRCCLKKDKNSKQQQSEKTQKSGAKQKSKRERKYRVIQISSAEKEWTLETTLGGLDLQILITEQQLYSLMVPQLVSADSHNALEHCCPGYGRYGAELEVENMPLGRDLWRPRSGLPVSLYETDHCFSPRFPALCPRGF